MKTKSQLIKEFIQFEIKRQLNENDVLKSLTPQSMSDAFPVSEKDIMAVIKKACKGRDVKIDNRIYLSSNTHNYGTFAMLQKDLSLNILDAGQGDVTAGGTYHSSRGIGLSFHFRGDWKKDGIPHFTMNASKTTPGGMAVYDMQDVFNVKDILYYATDIIKSNKKNDIQSEVY